MEILYLIFKGIVLTIIIVMIIKFIWFYIQIDGACNKNRKIHKTQKKDVLDERSNIIKKRQI